MQLSELRLRPDWERPETWVPALSAFVATTGTDSRARLWLDVSESGLPGEVLLEMIGAVCEWASAGEDFAEVVVSDGRGEGPAAALSGPDAVFRALGAAGGSLPDDPSEIVARARAAKAIADHVAAIRDRWRFESAPRPRADGEPLVSVRIPTWRGHELLVSRAIPSVLNGSYRNVEVVVCSDGPDPDARRAVAGVGDPRVRYVEVSERPNYAQHHQSFWMTAGSMSANGALAACRGDWIAPLDHDDAFTRDHIHELLAAARDSGADLVYGQGACETREGPWQIVGSAPLGLGRITHGSVLHSRRLAHFRFDPHCWLGEEPGDWNLWRRMAEAGAAVAHLPRVVFIHFKEKTSIEARSDVGPADLGPPPPAGDAVLARDVLGSDARWLLGVRRRAAVGAVRP